MQFQFDPLIVAERLRRGSGRRDDILEKRRRTELLHLPPKLEQPIVDGATQIGLSGTIMDEKRRKLRASFNRKQQRREIKGYDLQRIDGSRRPLAPNM